MEKSKEELKKYFETGDIPTEGQYADLIDSFLDAKQPEGEANRRFVINESGQVSIASKEESKSEFTNAEIQKIKTGLRKSSLLGLNNFVNRKAIPPYPWMDGTSMVTFKNYNDGKISGNYLLIGNATVSGNVIWDYFRNNEKIQILFYKNSNVGTEFTLERTKELQIEGFVIFKVNPFSNSAFNAFAPETEGRYVVNSYVFPIKAVSSDVGKIPEYTMSDIVNNRISLLKDGKVVKQIDLTRYVDDTNLARLISGTVASNGIATFKRDDNSNFTVDFSKLLPTAISLDNLTDAQSNVNSVLIGTKETPDSVGETRGVNNVVVGKDAILDGVGNDNVLIGKSVLGGLGGNRNNNSNNNVVIGSKAAEDRIFFNDNVVIGSNSVTTDGSGNRNIVVGSNIEIGGHGVNDQLNIGNAIKGDLSTKIIELEKLKLSQLENGDITSDKLLGIDSSGNVKKIDSGNIGLPANFYEERVFTPKLYAKEGNQNEYTVGTASGKVVRIGNLVKFNLSLKDISDPSDISGEGMYITGFPFQNDKIGATYASSDSIISFRASGMESGVEVIDLTTFLLINRILIINRKNSERVKNISFNGGVSTNDIVISGSYITNVYKP